MKFTKMFFVGLISLFVAGCSNDEVARKALYEGHFHEVEILGYTFFGCSASDFIHTKFKAKSTFGKPVTGVVCSSPFSDKVQIKHTELE